MRKGTWIRQKDGSVVPGVRRPSGRIEPLTPSPDPVPAPSDPPEPTEENAGHRPEGNEGQPGPIPEQPEKGTD